MIDLTKFCSPITEVRPLVVYPLTEKVKFHCSNGRVIVITPDDGGSFQDAPESVSRRVSSMLAENPIEHGWVDVAEIQFPNEPADLCWICNGVGHVLAKDCPDCDGDGEFSHGAHWYSCMECDGGGAAYSPAIEKLPSNSCSSCHGNGTMVRRIPVGKSGYSEAYLKLLQELPNCEICPTEANLAAPFRFTGGRGWLMPMWDGKAGASHD